MSATLTNPQIGMGITGTLSSTTGGATTTTAISHTHTSAPTVGSSAGNVNKSWTGTVTIADSGTPNSATDLTSGLTDPQGNALVFSVVQYMLLENLSATAANIVTPFGGSNGLLATGTIPLNALGAIEYDGGTAGDGIAVDATHKLIKLTTAAGTNVQVKITIYGR